MAKDLQSNTSEDTEEKIQQMDEGVPIKDANTNNVAIDSRRELLEAMGLGQEDEPNAPRAGFAVPSTADEIEGARLRWGEGTWQMKALRFINSNFVQKLLVGLLVMDVFILLGELG